MQATQEFKLSCSGTDGRGAIARVTVNVREPRTIDVTLAAYPRKLQPGESSQISWRALNAKECRAEGAWQGAKAIRGAFDTGPLSRSATFKLICRNDDVEEVAILNVDVAAFALRWQPPARNTDGSRADDIAGYRVYWGQRAGKFTGSYTINSPTATEWQPRLPSGRYYFAISAFDSSGNESEKSAPVRLLVP